MKKTSTLMSAILASTAVSANGVYEVVRLQSELHIIGWLVFLTTITAITFILVLLACGTSEPVL